MNKLNYQAHMHLVNFLSMVQKGHKYHCFKDGFYFIHKNHSLSYSRCYFPGAISNHCCYSTPTKNNLHSIQMEQEFSGMNLPQLPAIIRSVSNSENYIFPDWFTLRLNLSHFLSVTHDMHSALVFPNLFFRLNPNYCPTS